MMTPDMVARNIANAFEMVKSAINDIDGEWPNDLVRLSNVMTGLVESNAISEMF